MSMALSSDTSIVEISFYALTVCTLSMEKGKKGWGEDGASKYNTIFVCRQQLGVIAVHTRCMHYNSESIKKSRFLSMHTN